MNELGFEIGRYRSRPVEVTMTEPITEANREAIYSWVLGTGGHATLTPRGYEVAMVIQTYEGNMDALYGDRIVYGTRDEHYPIKPGPFADKYEAVDDEHLVAGE